MKSTIASAMAAGIGTASTRSLPASLDAHIDLLERTFPADAEAIALFFRELLRIYRHFYRGRREPARIQTRYNANP